MTVTILVFAFLMVVFIYSYRSYRKRLRSGCCGGGGSENLKIKRIKDRDKSRYPYSVKLTIDGMICANCAIHIQNCLNELEGTWAKVDLSSRSALILTKEAPDEELIRKTVNSIGGYTVLTYESFNL